jgi:hypothetical protein
MTRVTWVTVEYKQGFPWWKDIFERTDFQFIASGSVKRVSQYRANDRAE